MLPGNEPWLQPFPAFLEGLKSRMQQVFRDFRDVDSATITRGVPPAVIREIMSQNPLAVSIPEAHGGRGGHVSEILAVLSAASYESLPFALTIGINSALFIQPVAKYARDEVRGQVFRQILQGGSMGGLMITEPGHGSNALHMQTNFTGSDGEFHIRGTKHWAGLTGYARYWLLTARELSHSGDLKKDIRFFICDTEQPGQNIVVEELFDNLGLYQIPYGRNRVDVRVPASFQLEPETTGINMLLDLLHRSRLQFPGMALGFIRRMMDEAVGHCRERFVGGRSLLTYDQVQKRLAAMQASYTISSAMCAYSSNRAGIGSDLSAGGLVPNSFKTVVTDLMQEAAQSLVQLVGARAYRFSHIGGRGIVDSRPFQIFEGSNDILYAQISESVLKHMKKTKEHNFHRALFSILPAGYSAGMLKGTLDFELNANLPQRKLVELGKIVSRVVSMEMVMQLGNLGFRQEMIGNATEFLRSDIDGLLGNFRAPASACLVEDYHQDSSWLDLIRE